VKSFLTGSHDLAMAVGLLLSGVIVFAADIEDRGFMKAG
jgi:hypothetical protein